MPEWALYYAYAEEFHCHPQDVPQVVTVEAWQRWLALKKARASRDVYQAWRAGHGKNMTPEQQELFNWPAGGDY